MTTDQNPDRGDEVDADVVASRAAQVITTMGAEIRALKGERDRFRSAWCSARERAQAYGEGILRVVKDREQHQEWLRQAEERAAVPSAAAPPTQAALRDRIRRAVCEAEGFGWDTDMLEPDEYGEVADAVLAVLPAPVDRAAVLLWAADQIDAETRQAKADGVLEPDKYRPCRDASAQMRRLAEAPQPETQTRDCPACDAKITHDEHCPTPESHNWGCGCPSDVAAAIASCPGYEMSPSPCRCPCYGCKHHCGAHNPPAAPAVVAQPGMER